jgi:uncharacterized membrane protein YphA (DoxX/SURF4 family)
MKSHIAYLMAAVRHGERGSIDAYVTKAVMIFLAVAGAFVLIGLNTRLFGWVTTLVEGLINKPSPL